MLVVLPHPESKEDCFTSDTCQFLINKFKEHSIKNYAITYLVKCFPGEKKKPNKYQLETCVGNHLSNELGEFNLDLIVPVGSTPLQLFRPDLKISECAGDVVKIDGGVLFPLINPASIKHNTRMAVDFNIQTSALGKYINFRDAKIPSVDYQSYKTEEVPIHLMGWYKQLVSIDIETTGLDPYKDRVRCCSFCKDSGRSICVDFGNPPINPMGTPFWRHNTFLAHNAKFEYRFLRKLLGVEPDIMEDTQMMHHLLYEEEPHHLDTLSRLFTSIGGFKDESVEWLRANNNDWSKIPMEILGRRNNGDTDATLRIYKVLYPKLKEENLEWMYRNISIPSQYCASKIEDRGMYVDTKVLQSLKESEQKRADDNLKYICDKYNIETVNFRSPKQVRELLFDLMKLPQSGLMTDSNLPSTDVDAMETIMHMVKEDKEKVADLKMILDSRSALYNVGKADEIFNFIRNDSTVSSSLNYTVTGRFTSREPNMQNFPTDAVLKKAFKSRFRGGMIIETDYSQLELRLIGSESGCRDLVEAYKNKRDIHDETSKQFGLSRSDAKRVNFAVAYGVGSKKLSRELKISVEDAKDFLREKGKQWWEIQMWRERQKELCRQMGYVRNKFGRKRRLPNISSPDTGLRIDAELQSGNFPIQSFGADTVNYAMARIEQLLQPRNSVSKFKSIIINQIHDSIIVDFHPDDDLTEVVNIIYESMVTYPMQKGFYKIPLDVEVKTGPTWGELTKEELCAD